MDSDLQECPACHERVVPKRNGTCPACGAAEWPSQLSEAETEEENIQTELHQARTRIAELETTVHKLRKRVLVDNFLMGMVLFLALLRILGIAK